MQHTGIALCLGCENEILDLSNNTERNIAIADYLDSNYGLFDRPLYNNVHTAVFNIQEKGSIFCFGTFLCYACAVWAIPSLENQGERK